MLIMCVSSLTPQNTCIENFIDKILQSERQEKVTEHTDVEE